MLVPAQRSNSVPRSIVISGKLLETMRPVARSHRTQHRDVAVVPPLRRLVGLAQEREAVDRIRAVVGTLPERPAPAVPNRVDGGRRHDVLEPLELADDRRAL